MTIGLWLSRNYVAVPVIAATAIAVYLLGWWCSWMTRDRYVDKRIAEGVVVDYAELIRRCEVAEAKAMAYGLGLRAAGATMCDMAELSAHEVKVVVVGGGKNDRLTEDA